MKRLFFAIFRFFKPWYYVEGVRYCTFCRTRRCRRQVGGSLDCVRDADRKA